MWLFPIVTLIVCALLAALALEMEPGSADPKRVILSFLLSGLLINGVVWIVVRGRKRWKELLLSAGTLFVMLVVSEFAMRWTMPHRTLRLFRHCRSSRFHHVAPPDRRMYRGRYEGKHVFITTNEDGLRTEYSRKSFLRHRTRLFVLGDSFTFGFGVKQDKVFTQVLEDRLRRSYPNRDVAVMNAGSISYSPFLEARRLEDLGPHYKPHHVLLFLDPGDIGDDIRYRTLIEQSGTANETFYASDADPVPYYGAIWKLSTPYHSLFTEPFRLARKLIGAGSDSETPAVRPLETEIEVEIEGTIERNRFFIYRYPVEKTQPYFDATAQHLATIAETARKIGADFTLFVLPRYHHWNPKESPRNWEVRERHRYTLNEPYQFEYFRYFEELRDQVDYRIVNLLDDFRATQEFPLVFDEDPHWTERGHAFVGRTVHGYVSEMLESTNGAMD